MSPTLDAFLRSWPFDPWLLAALALSAGDLLARLARPASPRPATLAAAAGSRAFSAAWRRSSWPWRRRSSRSPRLLLQVHMVQHLLLMMVAPPLLWLGAPLFPLLRGLPRPIRTYWVAPLFRSASLRRLFGRLTHPAAALAVFIAATWLWHVPRALRARPALAGLALSAARLLPRRRPAVLVSRGPALSGPAALVALAAVPLPDPGRRAEHRSCRPC